jgi:hypothetical protein
VVPFFTGKWYQFTPSLKFRKNAQSPGTESSAACRNSTGGMTLSEGSEVLSCTISKAFVTRVLILLFSGIFKEVILSN